MSTQLSQDEMQAAASTNEDAVRVNIANGVAKFYEENGRQIDNLGTAGMTTTMHTRTVPANATVSADQIELRKSDMSTEGFADTGVSATEAIVSSQSGLLSKISASKKHDNAVRDANNQTNMRESAMQMNRQLQKTDTTRAMWRIAMLFGFAALVLFLSAFVQIHSGIMTALFVLVGLFLGREVFFFMEGDYYYEAPEYESIRSRGGKLPGAENFADATPKKEKEPEGACPDDTFLASVL